MLMKVRMCEAIRAHQDVGSASGYSRRTHARDAPDPWGCALARIVHARHATSEKPRRQIFTTNQCEEDENRDD